MRAPSSINHCSVSVSVMKVMNVMSVVRRLDELLVEVKFVDGNEESVGKEVV
jgi:hypothetical protein